MGYSDSSFDSAGAQIISKGFRIEYALPDPRVRAKAGDAAGVKTASYSMSGNENQDQTTPATDYPAPDTPERGLFWYKLSIYYRIALAIGVLMVACIGILAGVIVQHQNQVFRQQIDDLGNTVAAQIARSVAEPIMSEDELTMDVLTTNLTADVNVVGTAIVSKDWEILTREGLTPFGESGPWYGKNDITVSQIGGLEWKVPGRRLVSYARPVIFKNVHAGYVVVTMSRAALSHSMENATRSIVLATLLVLALGTVLTLLLSRRMSRPIHDIINASRALDEGAYDFSPPSVRKDELGGVMNVMQRMAVGMQRKEKVESTLSRYVSHRVAEAVLDHDTPNLGGHRVEATVLFADIVGFTRMAEGMDPEEVASLLNEYFSHIARACESNHGVVDKYIGDCAMMVFGTPQPDEDHCYRGICTALIIERLVALENIQREKRGYPPVMFRFGLNSGSMLAGNMGTHERMEYTVVGGSVNLASRLSSVADGGQIVITEALYRRPGIRDRIIAREHGAIQLRGIEQPVTTLVVEGLVPAESEKLTRQIETLWWQSRRQIA